MQAAESKSKAQEEGEKSSSGKSTETENTFAGVLPNYLQSGPPVIQKKADSSAAMPEGDELKDAVVQTKMAVSSPDDEYEKEADEVADVVVQRSQKSPDRDKEPIPEARLTPPEVRLKPTANIQRKPLSSGSMGALSNNALTPPDEGKPLNPEIRESVGSVMQADVSNVRVHDSPSAQQTAGRMNARAFTNQNHIWLGQGESANDTKLMAHETAHVVQQTSSNTPVAPIQRQVADPAPVTPASHEPPASGGGDPSEGGGGVPANMSMEEMEQRLASTPADGAAVGGQGVSPSPETESTLNDVEGGEGAEAEEGESEEGEEGEEQATEEETSEEGGEEESTGAGEGGERGGGGGAPEADAASTYEALVDNDVGAYLNGDAAPDRLTTLNDTTTALLGATEELSQQQVSDPEPHGFLASVTGLGPLADAFTRVSPGYEQEATWLQVVAQIRDICSSLGGVVGMIGLVATVSGLIMSLLVPPVGAFLLTAGRFCDMAALILDAIALVTGIILTGYNLYRLKNATDPEEKRRLLGMVRQDAMGTVMSGLSVATAVAPGAAKALGRTRAGQTAGRALSRVSSFAGDVAGGAARRLAPSGSRLARASSAVGGMGRSIAGRAGRAGSAVSARFHRGAERIRRIGGRMARSGAGRAVGRAGRSVADFAPIRGLRNVASNVDARLLNSGGFAGRARRYAGQVHRESRLAADAIHLGSVQHRSVRAMHLMEARAMRRTRAELMGPNPGTMTPAQLRAVEDEIYRRHWLADDRSAISLRQRSSGEYDFGRTDSRMFGSHSLDAPGGGSESVLQRIRRQEAERVREVQARIDREFGSPPASATPDDLRAWQRSRDARVADELNTPTAPARWTPEEIAEFRAGRAESARGQVYKTPHHTMRFADAPHLHRDPRLIQMGNAPGTSSYRPFTQRSAAASAAHSDEAAAAAAGVPYTPSAPPRYFGGAGTKARVEQAIADGEFPGITNLTDLRRAVRDQGQGGLFTTGVAGNQSHNLFDEHLLVGHGLVTAETNAWKLFDNTAGLNQIQREAMLGSGVRGLGDHRWGGVLGQAARQAPRSAAGTEGYSDMIGAGVDFAGGVASEIGSMFSGGGGEESASASASMLGGAAYLPGFLGGSGTSIDISGSASMLSLLNAASGRTVTPGASPQAAGGATESEAGPEGMGTEMEIAEPPPSPAEYSPEQLNSISQQREAVGSAIEAVSAYIAQTETSIETNQQAKGAAEQLKERNQARDEGAETEKQDVAEQQSKLEQSSGAQENMKSEQESASGEADRGNSEASNVQSQGDVEVEAKQEEPRSRSWLERAWDATGGAVWERLVRPVINAARRKVSQVMEGINNFIMDMINQALGLDEIEAELNAGGEDITARETSLTESDTGLGEVQATSQTEAENNQSTADQADANIEEATGHQSEASMLMDALVAHHQVLTEEEEAGTAYVSRIPGQYGEYFAQQAELESMPPQDQAVPEQTDSSEDRIGAAEVTMVSMFIENVIDAEMSTQGELTGLAGQSSSAIDPAYADMEVEASGVAMSEFNASSSSRLSRATNLLGRASECQGMSASEGMAALESVFQEAINIADELEAARAGVIQSMAAVHQQALAAGGEEGGDENSSPMMT